MIRREELESIGRLVKPHGIKGEITATIDVDGLDVASLSCVVVYVDGIAVPFFIEAVRRRSHSSVLITFDGITDEKSAAELCNSDLYALMAELPAELQAPYDEEGMYASDLIGFNAETPQGVLLGEVTDIEDSTANVLFIITTPTGEAIYIPVADEFIVEIDSDARRLVVDAPEEIINLNS